MTFCAWSAFETSETVTALLEEILPLCGEGGRLIPPF
jgi:hypothetical protein